MSVEYMSSLFTRVCCLYDLQWDFMYTAEFDVLSLGDDGEPMVHRKNLQDFIAFFFSTGPFEPCSH